VKQKRKQHLISEKKKQNQKPRQNQNQKQKKKTQNEEKQENKPTTETTTTTNANQENKKPENTENANVEEKKPSEEEAPYAYEFLASRIFDLINASGEGERVKYSIKPPQVIKDGTKKIIWTNSQEICETMNRQPDHVLSFFMAELGTTISLDGSGRFVIKGKFQPKHIENILKRYIHEYVKCHGCKTPHTQLKRENRLVFMLCEKCGSSRTVVPIKSGFQATTRASRRAEKNA